MYVIFTGIFSEHTVWMRIFSMRMGSICRGITHWGALLQRRSRKQILHRNPHQLLQVRYLGGLLPSSDRDCDTSSGISVMICSSYIALYPRTSSEHFTYYHPRHTCTHQHLLNSSAGAYNPVTCYKVPWVINVQ